MSGLTLRITDPVERDNLAAFVARALQLDGAAAVRLRRRSTPGQLTAWTTTGFGMLAARTVQAELAVADATVGGDTLRDGLAGISQSGAQVPAAVSSSPADGIVALGYSMDSAWKGALPPESGFHHIDDVPARMLLDLAHRGAEVARANPGPQGPPRSLLDQDVLSVTAAGAAPDASVGIPMRAVFALTAMGFVPDPAAAEELVRVRATPVWLRLDARFGSVAQRRGADLAITVR